MPETINGLRELEIKLASMDRKVAGKTLRSAALLATTPALKALKAAAPRGKKLHRTYKGNLVAPGFLSRSIKRKTSYRNGVARVVIGIKKEAAYGILFVEKGTKPHRIPKRGIRRMAFGGKVVSHVNHPGARAKPWFRKTFEANRKTMEKRFAEQLRRKIERHFR